MKQKAGIRVHVHGEPGVSTYPVLQLRRQKFRYDRHPAADGRALSDVRIRHCGEGRRHDHGLCPSSCGTSFGPAAILIGMRRHSPDDFRDVASPITAQSSHDSHLPLRVQDPSDIVLVVTVSRSVCISPPYHADTMQGLPEGFRGHL